MDPERVTLAVPCYNVEDHLPSLFDALNRLSPSPHRIICIDDGSTDETKKIIKSYDDADLVVHKENKGLAAARNSALEATETHGLAMLDADVIPDEDWLSAICEAMEKRGADMVGGALHEQVTTTADEWRAVHLPQQFGDEPLSRKWVPGSNFLCRVRAVRAVGGWNEKYRTNYEDVDIGLRLKEEGYKVWYTPHAQAKHTRTDSVYTVLSTTWDWYYKYSEEYSPPIQFSKLPRRVKRHLRLTKYDLYDDIRNNWKIMPITILKPFVHTKRDIEYILDHQ